MFVNPKRIRVLVRREKAKGPVVYWMGRDQRACDNCALLHAKELAEKHDSPLAVVFCLVPKFLGATSRQYRFMLQGLKEVERNLRALDIAFFLLLGDPGQEIPKFLSDQDASSSKSMQKTEENISTPPKSWKGHAPMMTYGMQLRWRWSTKEKCTAI